MKRTLQALLILLAFLGFLMPTATAQTRKVVLQVFWWDFENRNYPLGWANYLAEMAPRLKTMGVDAIWIPPSVKNASFGSVPGVGYAPFDNYDIGDKFQKGFTKTRFGTKDEFLRMIAIMHANGIEVIQDIVLNHFIGAGSDNGSGGQDPAAYGGEKWTNFRYVAWGSPATDQNLADYTNRIGRFYKTRNNFHPNPADNCTTGDICSAYWGPDISYNDGSFGEASNMPAPAGSGGQYNGYMKAETNKWLVWYKKQTGFDGVRMDAVKHFDYSASEGALWNMQNAAGWANGGNNMFAVGEFVGGASELDNWCNAVNNRAGTFDFGLRGFTGAGLVGITQANGNYNLGNIPSEQQSNRQRTVPFVNNHDTFRPILDANGNYSKPLGDASGWNTGSQLGTHIDPRDPRLSLTYAVMLAVDGSPQMFMEDLFDVGTTGKRFTHDPKSTSELPTRSDLENILWCRQNLDFMGGAYKVRWQATDALVIERSTKALICVNDQWNTWQNLTGVQTDFPDGTVLKDYSGANGTGTKTVYGGGKVNLDIPPCDGTANSGRRGYAIWAPQGIVGTYNPSRSTVTTQEWEMANDLGDSHCQSLGQGGALPLNSTVQRTVGKIYVQAGQNVNYNLYAFTTADLTIGLYDLNGNKIHSANANITTSAGLTANYTPTTTGWLAIKVNNTTNTSPAQNCWIKASYTAPATITNANVTVANNQAAIWTGAADNVWDNCRNWEQGILPNSNIDALFPATNNTNFISVTGNMVCKNLRIEQGNAIFIAASGKIDVTSDLVAEGNITNNGILNVGNNLIASNNGNQNFGGSGNTNIANQLNINKTAGTLNWALQNTSTKDYLQNNGALSLIGNVNALLKISGNWTKTAGTFAQTDGKVSFNGANLQNYLSNDLITFKNLEINKVGNDLKLTNGFNVSANLFVTAGQVDLNGQIIDLGTTGVLQESLMNNSLVKDNLGTGKIRRQNLTFDNTTSAVNLAGLGLFLDQAAGAVNFDVERKHNQLGSVNTVIRRSFKFAINTGTVNNANLSMIYADPEFAALPIAENNFKLLSYNGTVFTDLGGTNNATNNKLTATGLNSLANEWTLGEKKTDITVTFNPTTVTEGGVSTLTFSRGVETVGDLLVNFNLNGSTTTFPADFTTVYGAIGFSSANGSILIPNGNTTASIFITSFDDGLDEQPSENLRINLIAGAGYTLGTPNIANLTITDNDNAGFTFSAPVNTNRSGSTATFSGVLNSPPTANVSINLTSNNTTNGGTISPSSFTFTPSNWNFAQFATITGATGGTGNTNYNIVTSAATSTDPKYSGLDPADVSATNVDQLYTVQISAGTAPAESATNGTFNISVNPAPTSALTVNMAVSGTATGSGTDYTLANGTNTSAVSTTSFTFAAGQTSGTLAINAADDALIENGENIFISIGNGSAYTVGANGTANLILNDNDAGTVNGTIAAGEYGTHTDGQNQQTAYGTITWLMNWDNNNLYVAISGATNSQGAVLYLDKDLLTPVNGGTNANGTNIGQGYDGVNFSALPFRSDFVLYFKNGYYEYRTPNGSNGWNASVTTGLTYADNGGGGNVREVAIPWSVLGGKPAKFAFMGFISNNSNNAYADIPFSGDANVAYSTTNITERYYAVHTSDGTVKPFSRESYTYLGTTDYTSFGNISVYDLTINNTGRTITRATGGGGTWDILGNLVIANGTLSSGASTTPINVTGDVIMSGGTFGLSSAAGGDINLQGNWNKTAGTFTHNGRAVGFNGAKFQTLNQDANNFGFISLNKSANNVQLLNSINVANTFTLTQGKLDLNVNSLALGTTGVLVEDRANNHVVFGLGTVSATRTGINALTDIAGTGISLNGTGLGVTVTRGHISSSNTIKKGYLLSGISGTIGGTMEIEYASSELNNLTDANLRMITVSGINSALQGGTVNVGTRKVTLTGLTAYGSDRWTLGTAPSIDVESPIATLISNNGTRASVGTFAVNTNNFFAFRIKNTGSGNLQISNINLAGANASDFVFSNPPAFPLNIASGGQFDLNLTFKPSAAGTRNASITFVNSDQNKPNYLVNISGVGVNAQAIALESPVATAQTNLANINYGNQSINSNTDRVYRIANTGGTNLALSGVFITGNNVSDFSIQTALNPPINIAPASNLDITIRFKPTALGNRFASVSIFSNDQTQGNFQLGLQGTGVTPFISVESPTSTAIPNGQNRPAFISALINTTADYVFTVRNNGSSDLNLTTVGLSGGDPSQFVLVSPPTFPQVVTAGNSYNFTLRFAPTSAGVKNAVISFGSNDPTIPNYSLGISGACIAPKTDLFMPAGASFISGGSYQFGQVNQGTNQTAIFKIKNNGNAFLTVSNGNFTGSSDFAFNPAPTFPMYLNPLEENFVTVRFTATGTGTKTAQISFANTDANVNPYVVFMTGNVTVPVINVKTSANITNNDFTPSLADFTDFSSVVISFSTVNSQFTTSFLVENTGTGNLNIQNVSLSGANAGDFIINSTLSAITQGGANPFQITFKPTGSGLRTAFVTINSDDATKPSYRFAIQGTGLMANMNVKFNALNVPNTVGVVQLPPALASQTLNAFITIENTLLGGSESLTLNNFQINGTAGSAFSTVSWANPFISSAQNTTFQLNFNTAYAGNYTAFITIGNNDHQRNPYTFTVFATANAPQINIKDATVNIPNNTGQIHFASVNVASNLGKNIVIENLGNANLSFNSLQINGAHAGMFTTVFTSANPILPANAVSFDLKYQPSSIGFHTAFITVSSNDLLKNPYTFAVFGHGNPNPDIFVTVSNTPIAINGQRDLGVTSVNTNLTTFITISNSGTTPLNLGNILVNGFGSGIGFVSSAVSTQNVAPNTNANLSLTFNTTTAGNYTAFVTVENNVSGKNPYTFTVFATANAPQINIKDATVNIPNNTGQIHFASVNVASNVGRNIVIENLGNANLNFNSLQINGAHAGMFTTVFTSANPILPANAVSFDLKYQPSSIGFHTAFITVSSNDLLKNPYTFAVFGYGNPNPDIFVTVNNVGIANNGQRDLGTISVGVNLTAFITISNSGTTALNLGNIQINGSGAGAFTSSAVSTQNVAPNTSATLSLTFNTAFAGNYTAFVTVENNVLGKNPYTFTIFATASVIPDIAVKQAANILVNGAGNYVFANQNVNSASADVTFAIENAGSANLLLTGNPKIAISGANAGDFLITQGTTLTTVTANNQTTFLVKFSPTTAGAKTATISISNNVLAKNPYTFTLQGTGIALTTVNPPLATVALPNNNQQPSTVGTATPVLNLTINSQNVPIAPAGQATTFVTAQPLRFNSQLDFSLPQGFTLLPFDASQATVSNGKITLNAVGQIKLTVIRPDKTFSQIILNVEKANAFITTNANTTASVGNLTCQSPAFALPFSSNSPEKINLTVLSGKAEIQNNLVKVLGTGLVKIRATQAENNNFTSAQSFDFDFNVNKASRSVALPAYYKNFGDADFVLPEDFNNEKLTYSSEAKNISISGNTVKILGAGQAVIKAVLAENDCYFASTFDLILNVSKAKQTINFPKIADQKIGNRNLVLQANASSNLPITFQVIEGQNLVSLQGNSLKINGIGKVKVLASQAGNENYLPAQAEQIFNIANDPSIRITNVSLANKNENLVIDFVTTGIFSENNDFTVFLSNPNGVFEGFVQQITFSGSNNGRISMAIPSQILRSGTYKIQIRSTNPNVLSNTFNVPRVLTPKPRTPVLTRIALVICADANISGKFQWFANGKLLPSETNRCLTISLSHGGRAEANQTILYTVIVIDEEGRESEISSPVEITSDQINLITGVDSDLDQNPIRVFPNPTKDRLVLDLTSKFLRKIEISIFNMLGQKVLGKSLSNSQKEEVLDVQNLPAGTYLLEILSEKGKHRQQIVKE